MYKVTMSSCKIDPVRSCSSKSKDANRYKRAELVDMAKKCGIKNIAAKTMDELCHLMKNEIPMVQDTNKVQMVSQIAQPPPPLTAANFVIKPADVLSLEAMLVKFKAVFRDDLLGFIDKPKDKPRFRVVTAGGFGLKTLMEGKFKVFDKVDTSDIDLTISTDNSTMAPSKAYAYWSEKVSKFISEQPNPKDFEVKVLNFGKAYVPILDYRRYYAILISYKKLEFVDVVITDFRFTPDMIDVPTSLASGLPVKTEEYYLLEFLTLIYMENVGGVDHFCYAKRNPVTGKLSCKGAKDLERSKLLCNVKESDKYITYCMLLEGVTVAKLKKIPEAQRTKYFALLKDLIKMSV